MQTTTNRQSRSGSTYSRRNKSSKSTFSHKKPNRKPRRGSFSRGNSSHNRGGGRGRGARKMPTFDPSQFINTNPVELKEEKYIPKNSFNTLGLNEKFVKTITQIGLVTPSPIQDQIIGEILEGKDVIGLAETGTGKTAAFLIPLIEKNIKNPKQQTLILTPTRELALQISDELYKLSKGFNIRGIVCVGGVNIRPQIRGLRNRNQFVIGTPGRVLDLIKQKHLVTKDITTVVLDEADRMLDMGFIGDVRAILSTTPQTRETLLFSATMNSDAQKLVHDFLRNPITVSVKKKDVTNSIEQNVIRYEHHKKFETLLELLLKPEFKRVLIFGSMKHSVKKLAIELSANNVPAESIHGNKSHVQRQRALSQFKRGEVRVLVATDVAARGIHVEEVTHVINYDLPNTFEDYVHRIGRTGRATKRGKAITFVAY